MQEFVRKIGEKSDQITSSKSIYDVGWLELISRNLVVGISRAIGGLIFNLLVLVAIGSILAKTIWPQAQSFYDTLTNASKTIIQFEQNLSKLGNFTQLNLK